MVVKKGGRREKFDRGKILGGLLKAAEKRPVSIRQLEEIVDEVEGMILENQDRELTSEQIGLHLMERLKDIDKVAYVRFASVYREFHDVKEFAKEIRHLVKNSEE
jgi:transcriptional repressor NrdR